MALVDEDQPVFGVVAAFSDRRAGETMSEVVEETEGSDAWLAAIEVPGVVLDARAVSDLLDHLEVVPGPSQKPLGLEQLALALERLDPFGQLGSDRREGRGLVILGHDVVHRGEHEDPLLLRQLFAGEGIEELE